MTHIPMVMTLCPALSPQQVQSAQGHAEVSEVMTPNDEGQGN